MSAPHQPASVYERRRAELAERLQGATAVLPAAHIVMRNADVEHDFRQDSDFLWLTGLDLDAPDAVAVICPSHPDPAHRYVLFLRPRDADAEVWEGPRLDPEDAVSKHGAGAAYPLSELAKRLPDLIGRSERLVLPLGRSAALEAKVWAAANAASRKWREGLIRPTIVEHPSRTLHELRLRKDATELAALRQAAAVTVDAHRAALAFARPGRFEWEVQAELESVMFKAGARRVAYGSIVASGPNATFLHYVRADRQLEAGDLLLIDAGAEIDGYAADVTRTFPVGGRFTPTQRQVYEIVLAAQLAAIAECAPGRPRLAAHDAALAILTQGLVDLGVLHLPEDEDQAEDQGVAKLIEDEAYKPYYMHGTGHWLGMDVHDAGAYVLPEPPPAPPVQRPLEPGMVTTIEPGLYFPPDAEAVPEHLRGIGIRIEDDILVTDTGPEVLTAALPKHPDDLEALLGDRSSR